MNGFHVLISSSPPCTQTKGCSFMVKEDFKHSTSPGLVDSQLH